MSKPIIKPGQVWKAHNKEVVRVLCLDGGDVIAQGANTPHRWNSSALETLLKSHDGADLEAASAEGWEVWVEGMESPDMSRVTVFEIKLSRAWETHWTTNPLKGLHTYRYKLKEEEQPTCPGCKKAWDHTMLFDDGNELKCPDCVAKAEQPRYNLFEIDWTATYVNIVSEWGKCFPSVGAKLGNYRIFGFTDNGLQGVFEDYFVQPCDHTGNRKYAIGRIE